MEGEVDGGDSVGESRPRDDVVRNKGPLDYHSAWAMGLMLSSSNGGGRN